MSDFTVPEEAYADEEVERYLEEADRAEAEAAAEAYEALDELQRLLETLPGGPGSRDQQFIARRLTELRQEGQQ